MWLQRPRTGIDSFGASRGPDLFKHFESPATPSRRSLEHLLLSNQTIKRNTTDGHQWVSTVTDASAATSARALYEAKRNNEIQIVAVNDLGDAQTNAHLTQYRHGAWQVPGTVGVEGDSICRQR
jgi:hypothetical protein